MNRSILIVICDFLLVCLMVFSSPDVNRMTEHNATPALKMELSTNEADAGKDLAAAMRVALDEEKRNHQQLAAELATARQSASQQAATLSQQLTERNQQVQSFQQQLQSRDQEARQYQQQQAALQQQFAAAQTNITILTSQLQNVSSDSVLSREKLAAMEDQIRKQADQAANLQKQLSQLALTNEMVKMERQKLVGDLQVAEAEKRAATTQAAQAQEEVKLERAQNAKLAEGVQALATNSMAIAKEVRDNRELAPNTIFSDLVSNRIEASFTASRPGLFGDSVHHKDTQTILVSDGTATYALCHLQDTPLTFFNPGIDWQVLSGSLGSRYTVLPIKSLSFQKQDPRVVLLPVTDAEARQLATHVYHISSDPFKFQDAVLVGAREGYYGECRFEIDLTTPQYVKLDRSFLKGLFGKFNPSSGDLVMSRGGEVLGIMVNGTYCLMLKDLGAAASLDFGSDVRSEHTGQTLARFYSTVQEMPFKLQ